MKTFTFDEIVSWGPCYDPSLFMSRDWAGTAIDVLTDPNSCPFHDRLWVITRSRTVHHSVLDEWKHWSTKRALEIVEQDLFQAKSLFPEYIPSKVQAGHFSWEDIDKVWDHIGRTEQIEKLKSLILERERHEKTK